jgi:hypothetical protein
VESTERTGDGHMWTPAIDRREKELKAIAKAERDEKGVAPEEEAGKEVWYRMWKFMDEQVHAWWRRDREGEREREMVYMRIILCACVCVCGA